MRHWDSAGDGWDTARWAGQSVPLGETEKLLLLLPSVSKGTVIFQGGWWGHHSATEGHFSLLPLLLSTSQKQVPICTFFLQKIMGRAGTRGDCSQKQPPPPPKKTPTF